MSEWWVREPQNARHFCGKWRANEQPAFAWAIARWCFFEENSLMACKCKLIFLLFIEWPVDEYLWPKGAIGCNSRDSSRAWLLDDLRLLWCSIDERKRQESGQTWHFEYIRDTAASWKFKLDLFLGLKMARCFVLLNFQLSSLVIRYDDIVGAADCKIWFSWWLQIVLSLSPVPGEMIQFDEHIFFRLVVDSTTNYNLFSPIMEVKNGCM